MRKSGMNMEKVRASNRSLILNYINDHGPSSRKDIAADAGLTQASVTQIVSSMISEGIIKETGHEVSREGRAGRRKILLDIDAYASLAISVNMEPDITTVAVCDLMGNVINGKGREALVTHFSTEKDTAPEIFLDTVADCCADLRDRIPARYKKRIDAVSFAVTGIVDREAGISRHAYGIWEEEVNVREILGKRLNLPVIIENNVDAFAIAELMFGTGRRHNDLFIIKWGPGVGSSVIINGHVYRGRHGKTAELGHMIAEPGGTPCICGRRGCLETRLSVSALNNIHSDAERLEAIDLFARSIVNTGTILAPGRIVMYGSLADNEKLRNELISACGKYDPAYNEKRIVHTGLSEKESFIGPAAVYTHHVFMAG